MKRQDQKMSEIWEMQVPEVTEKHEDKDSEFQTYRTPQVFLVGETTNLIAGFGMQALDESSKWGH